MRSTSRGRAYMASPHSCTGLRQPRAPSDRVWLGRGDRDQEGYDFSLQLLGTMRTAQLLLKADGVRHAHARQESPVHARRSLAGALDRLKGDSGLCSMMWASDRMRSTLVAQ